MKVSVLHTLRQTVLRVRAVLLLKCPIEFGEVDLSPTIPSRIWIQTGLSATLILPSSHQRGLFLLGSVPHSDPLNLPPSLQLSECCISLKVMIVCVCEDWTVDGCDNDVWRCQMILFFDSIHTGPERGTKDPWCYRNRP